MVHLGGRFVSAKTLESRAVAASQRRDSQSFFWYPDQTCVTKNHKPRETHMEVLGGEGAGRYLVYFVWKIVLNDFEAYSFDS